jgi:hypothetical protein
MKDRQIVQILHNPRFGPPFAVLPERFTYLSVEQATFAARRFTFWHTGSLLGWLLAKAHYYRLIWRELRK